MFKKRIYLDYASLATIDPRVLREMKKFSAPKYANPSSWYKEGVDAKKAMDEGRRKIADFIHALPDEIVFTSGGTEANCLALEGVIKAAKKTGIEKPHLLISTVEHSSILEIANQIEQRGCEVTKIGVDKNGVILLDKLKEAITPNTVLVSIMSVNNEIGTIQPIREIAKIIRHAKIGLNRVRLTEAVSSTSKNEEENGVAKRTRQNYPLFHTDAAQAALYNDLYVEKLGVDLLSLDGSKVYGPRGVGALYVRRGVPIKPIIYGGGQESGMRSGTENLPGIMGLAKALGIIASEQPDNSRIMVLRQMMIHGLRSVRPDIKVNGLIDGDSVSPHILNVSIPGIDNEFLVMQLDARGIACSTKSSCLHDRDESYVLKAIGANSKESIRFSFGRWTKARDVRKTLKILRKLL